MATADGRRRRCSLPAAVNFPPDLIPEFARRLTSLEDFFALRASCREYRALLPLIPSNLASQAPLLLLYHAATDSYALFKLSLRRCLRFRLPRRLPLARLGCRIAVDDHVTVLRILHPFTGEESCIPRPPDEVTHVVLSEDLVLAWGYLNRTTQYCLLQDADLRVASISGSYCLEDLIIVNGIIYVLVTSGNSISPGYRLGLVELSDIANSVQLVLLGDQMDARALDMHETSELYFFLAQCCSEVILLSAVEFDPRAYNLFRWNSEEAKWARITRLGGCTLFFMAHYFVGCLGPDHPGIARDSIYFTEDEGRWS